MDFLRILRIAVCVLVLLAIKAAASSPTPTRSNAESSYPADALRYLTDGNRGGTLSPYDDLVKRHAARIGMDWRLLSAIIWNESKYNARAHSNMSAKGLMQIRDIAAEHYGFPDVDLFNPSMNLQVGTMLLEDLFRSFRKEGMEPDDVVRFSLASYNSGGGTLARKRAEADSLGLDPNNWEDVASVYRLTSGYTPAYVEAVEATYAHYCSHVRE